MELLERIKTTSMVDEAWKAPLWVSIENDQNVTIVHADILCILSSHSPVSNIQYTSKDCTWFLRFDRILLSRGSNISILSFCAILRSENRSGNPLACILLLMYSVMRLIWYKNEVNMYAYDVNWTFNWKIAGFCVGFSYFSHFIIIQSFK